MTGQTAQSAAKPGSQALGSQAKVTGRGRNRRFKINLDPAEMAKRAGVAETFLRSIASRHRLMILCGLLEGELAVSEMLPRLGLTQSNLSRHLATLRADNLVATRREGSAIFYRIESDAVRPILAALFEVFCA